MVSTHHIVLDEKELRKENTGRPQDTRFLVPEKDRAAQNRTS